MFLVIFRQQKNKLIGEIFRVLKVGGITLNHIECDSKSLLYKWAKNYPKLYKKYFIEMYGHYGLELVSECFKRFRKAGFRPVKEIPNPCRSYLRPLNSYIILFDNEFSNKSKLIKVIVFFSKILCKNRLIYIITSVLLGLLSYIVDPFIPGDHHDSIEVVYTKPGNLEDF